MSNTGIGIDKITDADKKSVRNFMNLWNKGGVTQDVVVALFALYHKYVHKSPSNYKCGACKATIRNYWNNYLKN